VSTVCHESPCIIKHWSMIPLAYYCTLWTDAKGQRKGLLNTDIGIVQSNEGSRIRIEILCLHRDFYFIFKAAFGREDIESNVVDYCTTHSRPVSVQLGRLACIFLYFLFCFSGELQVKNNGLGFGMRAKVVRCLYNIIVWRATELNNYTYRRLYG